MARETAGSRGTVTTTTPNPMDPLEVHAKSQGFDVDDPNLYSMKADTGGIRCPHCGCGHHNVTQTRKSEHLVNGVVKEYIRRWRACRACGCTFATREVVEPEIPDQIKSPTQAKRVSKQIGKTLGNVLPVDANQLPDLPNPFIKDA